MRLIWTRRKGAARANHDEIAVDSLAEPEDGLADDGKPGAAIEGDGARSLLPHLQEDPGPQHRGGRSAGWGTAANGELIPLSTTPCYGLVQYTHC